MPLLNNFWHQKLLDDGWKIKTKVVFQVQFGPKLQVKFFSTIAKQLLRLRIAWPMEKKTKLQFGFNFAIPMQYLPFLGEINFPFPLNPSISFIDKYFLDASAHLIFYIYEFLERNLTLQEVFYLLPSNLQRESSFSLVSLCFDILFLLLVSTCVHECKRVTMNQHDYFKKWLHVIFPKKTFFIQINFGTFF